MKISDKTKKSLLERIDTFNLMHDCLYEARFRGKYLYLVRDDRATELLPICRLAYSGESESWVFAIYRYSTQSYEGDDLHFPGRELLDGTIEGAMKAGLKAYH